MAEILGLGITHYPAVVVEPEHWSKFLIRRTQAGQVPAKIFENKDQWPVQMREEWAEDQGEAAAEQHGVRMVDGSRKIRQALDEFDPDFVVMWGDDQYENFRNDCIPAFCIYILDQAISRPYNPVFFGSLGNMWGFQPDAEMVVRGHREGATSLSQSLIGAGFDIAYAYATRHREGLAHSFNNAILWLDYEQSGFPYPVVPFHVNCYGNRLTDISQDETGNRVADVSPPSPSPKRCFEIGRATAK